MLAPDAQSLMRSRYCAYVLGLPDYLLATWHESTRPQSMEPDPPGMKWLGLDVKRSALQDADHATVEFVARSKLGGRATTRPSAKARDTDKERARWLGCQPSSAAADRMRSRVGGLTPGRPLTATETDPLLTPARRATSTMVA